MRTRSKLRGLSGHFLKIEHPGEPNRMLRFRISIGPKEKKSYAKSNSVRDCGSCARSRHHGDAVRGFHRGECESHSAGRREANPNLRSRRSLSLPYEPRTITIVQRGE